jgi:hypothetical protein
MIRLWELELGLKQHLRYHKYIFNKALAFGHTFFLVEVLCARSIFCFHTQKLGPLVVATFTQESLRDPCKKVRGADAIL